MSVAFGSFVLVSSEFLPIGLLPRISVAFGVSNGTAGIMITITGLVAAFSAPTLSIVSGRVDRRWMLFGLTTLLLASNVIVAAAPVFAVALAARILLGVAVGGFWTIGPSLAPRFVAPHAVPKAVAMITAGVSIGTIAGLPVGELIGHITSWRVAFMAGAALALVALALQLRYLPPLPSSRRVKVADLVRLARTPVARIGLVASGMTVFANFAAYTFVTPYLEDNAHIGAGWVSLVLVGYGTTSIVGNFVAGSTITRSMTKTLLGSTLILVVSIGLLVVTTPWVALVVVLIGVWGLSWGATPVILQTWMMRAAPGAHEEGLSLFMFVVQLSIAGGSLGGGIVVDSLGEP
jgi:predicted MFS family arabinose efflux permease